MAAIIFVLLLAALAIAVANEVIVASNISSNASFYELQGIQGADTTQNVAQRQKAKKKGYEKEEKELEQLQVQKMQHYRIISAAQAAQREYYAAVSSGLGIDERRADLERRIPEARASLAELKTLTDRQLAVLRLIGGDESAMSIVRNFYESMEAVVKTLQVEELSEAQQEERQNKIQIQGNSSVAMARRIANGLDESEMTAEDKTLLESDVVEPGEKAIKGLGDILSNLPGILWAGFQGMGESSRLANEALDRYGSSMEGLMKMGRDLSFGQGMFNRRNMNQFQKRLDIIGSGVQQFLGNYSPFVKSVGRSIGRQADTDVGYGGDVVIRFADPKGRLYIVEDDAEGQHMRVIVDKLQTRWLDNDAEVRTMLIFEYDADGVGQVVRLFDQFAPGFERLLRQARVVYVYKTYKPSIWKSFTIEISFQDAEGREFQQFAAQQLKGVDIRKTGLDSRVLRTIAAVVPPKDPTVLRWLWERTGDAPARPRGERRNREGGVRSSSAARTPAKPAKTKVSKKGTIQPPSEGIEVLKALNIDEASKKAVLEEHEKAAANFEAGKYALALRQFGRAAKMAEGNYLDAYWAALTAHKAKNNAGVKEWLDRCLQIKSDYVPALEMKKALKLK
ncbi:MAG: hypothetical protein LBO82_10495 [Synergistaceae bacterium]|nr:hypothetical protein [Synergistaceae bacterium]